MRAPVDELAARRGPVLAILRHRPREDVVERLREARPTLARARSVLLEVRVDHGDVGATLERQRSGQRLEEQAAERIDVGPAVDLVAANLLGRDVVDRSHQLPVGRAAVRDALREPEVRQVGVLAAALEVEKDVRGLHVAVDEALCVRGVQGIGDLRGDGQGTFGARVRRPAAGAP